MGRDGDWPYKCGTSLAACQSTYKSSKSKERLGRGDVCGTGCWKEQLELCQVATVGGPQAQPQLVRQSPTIRENEIFASGENTGNFKAKRPLILQPSWYFDLKTTGCSGDVCSRSSS